MQVERLFEQVKDRRLLIELRAGQVKIYGDIFSSVPETDWDKHRETP